LRPGRQKCARNHIHHRLVERFALDIDQMPPREVTREISGLGLYQSDADKSETMVDAMEKLVSLNQTSAVESGRR
jgi:Mn-dependent DtxR family transcriptional regulator